MPEINPADGEPYVQTLRQRAEAMLRATRVDPASMTMQDAAALVYELQVHQMKLEIQKEELRQAMKEMSESRDRYSDLYEFAPIGYLALDNHGTVLEANLAAATMLGVDRQSLISRRIADFISPDGQDDFHLYQQAVNASLQKQVTELNMCQVNGTPMTVRLETIRQSQHGEHEAIWRTALIDITACRQVEACLRDERRFNVGLINTAQAIILMLDLEGRIVMFNRFLEELTDYRLDEVKGQSWIDLMVPLREQERIRGLLHQAVKGSRTRGNVNPIVAKDGHEIVIEWHDAPLLDETGQQVALLSVGLDVTAREAAERETRVLANAMANLAEGVLITADRLDWPGPTIIFVNEALCRITGYSATEMIGQTPRMLQGEKTDRQELERVKQELAIHKSCKFETVNYRKDGTSYEVEVHITPLFDGNGQRTNFIAIHRDVTERNRNASALHSSREHLRAVLNTAVDAIISIDREGIITSVNPAAEKMFGYRQDEMIGQNVKILMPSPFREEHDQYIANFDRTGKPRIIGIGREVVARRKDGSTFPIDLAVSQVDHLGLFTGIIRDITPRKVMEQHLAEARIDEQRHLSQELHDGLGGQMTGIGMLAKTMHLKLERAASPLAGEAAELLQFIKDAHDQLRTVAHGIMPVEVTSSGLLVALKDLAKRTDESGQYSCEFLCEDDVAIESPTLATHLYRIAQEAVSNAIRHGQPTQIAIRLKQADGLVTLIVKDNGIGIKELSNNQGGMGLRTMRYRANQIGAALTVQPVEAGGTEVSCVCSSKCSI